MQTTVVAAAIIREKLNLWNKSMAHCTHCRWCLYLAGLICWGFGCVSLGVSTHSRPQDSRQARVQCDEYLEVAIATPGTTMLTTVNKTTGLLLVLIDLLQQMEEGEGLIEESLKSLRRLAGSSFL